MTANINTIQLPNQISNILKSRTNNKYQQEDSFLIGKGGYTSDNTNILFDAIVALSLGKNVLLKGPTGSGKTKLADTLSSLFQQPMHSVNCSVDLDAEALLGYKTISDVNDRPTIDFIPGPVINAMQKGHLLYIDEINMAKPETLPILNGVLDYRKMITNPFTSEVVQAEEGFGVIAAINEGYVGTVPLNEALKNRFIVIEVPYIQGNSLENVLKEQSMLSDEKLIKSFVTLSADLITHVKQGNISEEAASIRALIDTCDLAVHLPPERAVQRGIIDKLEDEREKSAVKNIVETLFE
ncbi:MULTISPECIES: MoxR family ATPase [Bacillaceae]|uniref:ATP-binding protein n=1 Tax=Bacillaceae TaxID=186817 RepID=UPI002A0AF385|nr:MoxR family ATPase [Cytobacillus sp. IB215316]MDX8360070.1 MoxR family ATPase [Cytobacillus sp. IB215316]